MNNTKENAYITPTQLAINILKEPRENPAFIRALANAYTVADAYTILDAYIYARVPRAKKFR